MNTLMRAMSRVFRFELRRQGRRRGYLFVSIGIPLIALAFFFGYRAIDRSRQGSGAAPIAPEGPSPSGPMGQARPTGVVDKANLLPRSFLSGLTMFETEEAAAQALRSNRIGAYYVIPVDYLETGKIDMVIERFNLGNIVNTELKQALVEGVAAKANKRLDSKLIVRLQDKEYQFVTHSVTDTGGVRQEAGGDASFALVYLFGLMLIFSAFTTSGYLMQSVVEEKETRMVEMLLSSIRPGALLAGKILALGLLGLVQMLLWGGTAVFIMRQLIPTLPAGVTINISNTQIVILLLYFVLGYLLFSSVYATIGAFANNMREGPQLAAVVTLPAAIPMWATAIFAAAPNGPLAVGLSLFPITAPLAMVMRAAVTEVPITQLLLSIGLLLLTVLFTMWIAGRMFRVSTLLSGQGLRLTTLFRLLAHPER